MMSDNKLIIARLAFDARWAPIAEYFLNRDQIWSKYSKDFPNWSVSYVDLSLENKDKRRKVRLDSRRLVYTNDNVDKISVEIGFLSSFVRYMINTIKIKQLTRIGFREIILDHTEKSFEDITEELTDKYFKYRIPDTKLKDMAYIYQYEKQNITYNITSAVVKKDELKNRFDIESDVIPEVSVLYDIDCYVSNYNAHQSDNFIKLARKEIVTIMNAMRGE